MNQTNIRNFCIIAHIDHGKSTLADRLLEMTGTVEKRQMREQLLDSNPIERERGITIKLAPVRMEYQSLVAGHWSLEEKRESFSSSKDKRQKTNDYILNLIDTPGHVDFSYEVSRSLAACEGGVLVVDATKGVQAQTLANLELARRQKLVIIPVINKIDLPNAQVDTVKEQLVKLAFSIEEIVEVSAKFGTHLDRVLDSIVNRIPEPKGQKEAPLRALVFSSHFDVHKGVVVYVRVVDGSINNQQLATNNHLQFIATGVEFEPLEVGVFSPMMKPVAALRTGEVGYIATGLKDVRKAKVGDTITLTREAQSSKVKTQILKTESTRNSTGSTGTTSITGAIKSTDEKIRGIVNTLDARDTFITPLPGYKEPKSMVFLGLFPVENEDINKVREALDKLRLADSAFNYKPISSVALGQGFHCGFLGLLHAEVVQERLTGEFDLSLIATAPTVEYRIKLAISLQPSATRMSESRKLTAEGFNFIQSAAEMPDESLIESVEEPVMQVEIFAPRDYVGSVMRLSQVKRAEYIDLKFPSSKQAHFTYLMPLSEMIVDFFDQLKSNTQGYASMTYEFFDYQPVNVVKLDILLNHKKVDAFSQLVVKEKAESVGRRLVDRLKDVIPRHNFAIPVQAAIGGKIIARADIKPFRKDVTQKLYGGDRTRKDKLLETQKKGKRKMKMFGRVNIPQEAFIKVFKRE